MAKIAMDAKLYAAGRASWEKELPAGCGVYEVSPVGPVEIDPELPTGHYLMAREAIVERVIWSDLRWGDPRITGLVRSAVLLGVLPLEEVGAVAAELASPGAEP